MTLTGRERKSFELGEPIGGASSRLYKKIFFSLVQATGRDICYRCGELIATADDMSVDHKKPWLGNDPALFWDLDNIAFSHRSCNYGARKTSPRSKLHRQRISDTLKNRPKSERLVCSVLECDKPARARGWCQAHYSRWQRYGNVSPSIPLGLPRGVNGPVAAMREVQKFESL